MQREAQEAKMATSLRKSIYSKHRLSKTIAKQIGI
jgi:hypothetical protein